ncbi:MAG TPA: DCL family protein [Pedomonas sp.]|uniref:DCL family protein n=1 Tax=Pedomonas sp. TaxID=2976421 RepID=UPI002F3EC715
MGKARRVTLATQTFEKAGDARKFFTVMLNRYSIGDRVSTEDSVELSALLDRHDERDEKVGSGVAGFEVNTPPEGVGQFSKRCFWVVRDDGSKIDFSIGHCLKQKPYD